MSLFQEDFVVDIIKLLSWCQTSSFLNILAYQLPGRPLVEGHLLFEIDLVDDNLLPQN
jgi:hypothetical protein